MTVEKAVSDSTAAVKAAADDAAKSYDKLVAAVKANPIVVEDVIRHSTEVWLASTKAWANLLLVPAAIAESVKTP